MIRSWALDRYLRHRSLYLCLHAGCAANEAPQRQEKDRLSVALGKLRGVYSDNLIEVVEWCMAMDPLSRPQSVFALQKSSAARESGATPSSRCRSACACSLTPWCMTPRRICRNSVVRKEAQCLTAANANYEIFRIPVEPSRGRALNEDRMGYCYTRESALFVLADGMGGHPDGEIAAQIALQVVSVHFQKMAKPTLEDPRAFLEEALLQAHRQILRYASIKGMIDTPRTTLVAAVVQDGHAYWAHCGDSRLYWVRDGQMMERTRDHSYSEMRKVSGLVTQSNRNVLFTCLGSPSKPIYDVSEAKRLEQGDQILLCSDGLWSSVPNAELLHIMRGKPVAQLVPQLVDTRARGRRQRQRDRAGAGVGDAQCLRALIHLHAGDCRPGF